LEIIVEEKLNMSPEVIEKMKQGTKRDTIEGKFKGGNHV